MSSFFFFFSCLEFLNLVNMSNMIKDTFEGSLRDAEPGFPKTTISRKPPQDDMGIPPTQRMSQVPFFSLYFIILLVLVVLVLSLILTNSGPRTRSLRLNTYYTNPSTNIT